MVYIEAAETKKQTKKQQQCAAIYRWLNSIATRSFSLSSLHGCKTSGVQDPRIGMTQETNAMERLKQIFGVGKKNYGLSPTPPPRALLRQPRHFFFIYLRSSWS